MLRDRQLEEDEAKVDNILHKIMVSSEKIKIVSSEIKGDEPTPGEVREKLDLLAEGIYNLSKLADDIVQHDEKLTKQLEAKTRGELSIAIKHIKDVEEMYE